MANSKRKCKQCKEYVPAESGYKTPGGFFCSTSHAIEYARELQKRSFKKETRARKEKLKPRSDYLKDCQVAFNRVIRLLDSYAACISCGRHHEGQYHAGHYMSVGARPELRFNLYNVHKQCSACNAYLSGNIANYRINLIEKIGIERVEALEGYNPPLKLSVERIKELTAFYRKWSKQLEKGE